MTREDLYNIYLGDIITVERTGQKLKVDGIDYGTLEIRVTDIKEDK